LDLFAAFATYRGFQAEPRSAILATQNAAIVIAFIQPLAGGRRRQNR
jgi:hypothetical protein